MSRPKISYTIWFSQRTGSSLLCDALTLTGVAGHPDEWLNTDNEQDLLKQFGAASLAEFQKQLWTRGSSSNDVFGLKVGIHEPFFSNLVCILRKLPECSQPDLLRAGVWNCAFPNHHHIFMTRRNKVRLAVSWWKAIQTRQWHRQGNEPVQVQDLSNAYDFNAIDQLYNESIMREAATENFLSEADIIPLTIVYEDFILDQKKTVQSVLDFLGLEQQAAFPVPKFKKLADRVSEDWVQRFRSEKQKGWTNQAW